VFRTKSSCCAGFGPRLGQVQLVADAALARRATAPLVPAAGPWDSRRFLGVLFNSKEGQHLDDLESPQLELSRASRGGKCAPAQVRGKVMEINSSPAIEP
jgi:hypothetical protein